MKIMPINRTAKEYRMSKGLKQKDISAWTGVTQAQISRFEAGQDVRLSTAKLITESLDLKLIVVPKEIIPQIESILYGKEHKTQGTVLEEYEIKDDDDEN